MNDNGNRTTWTWVIVAGTAVVAGCMGPEEASGDPADEVVTQTAELRASHRGHQDPCQRRLADAPAAIAVPTGSGLEALAHAEGEQIYTCIEGSWVLKAPEAELMDERGGYLGNHFLGPVWQWRDGSKVRGARLAQVPAPDPARDIPWLLLSATSVGRDGQLEGVTHIQRIHTAGGLAPAGGCQPGAETRVPYTADYLFFRSGACQVPERPALAPRSVDRS